MQTSALCPLLASDNNASFCEVFQMCSTCTRPGFLKCLQMLLRIREDGIACCPYACFTICIAAKCSSKQDVRFCQMNHGLTFVQSFDFIHDVKLSMRILSTCFMTIAYEADEPSCLFAGPGDREGCVFQPTVPRPDRSGSYGKDHCLFAVALLEAAPSWRWSNNTCTCARVHTEVDGELQH